MRIDDASRDGVLARERTAVIAYALAHPQDGYRRLTWQMLDAGVAALSESSVSRILAEADLLSRWKRSRSLGSAPPRPTQPNERWHTDLMYLRIADSWYFLITVLDAYSRYVVHWDLLTAMTAADVRRVIEEALQQTGARPQVVTDRGSSSRGRSSRSWCGGLDDQRRGVLAALAPPPLHTPLRWLTLNHMVQLRRAHLDASFAALSNATRRGILERLGHADASITELAEKFRMTLTGMKKHVGVLEQAGLVTTEKVGRVRTCKLGLRRLEEEAAWIERYHQLWDARFDELDRIVEELKREKRVDGRRKGT